MKSSIQEADAQDLTNAFSSLELSPREVVTDTLDRIHKYNREINAFCLIDEDQSVQQAAASEERWKSGSPLSPIDGVPVTIKDLLWVKDWPVTMGSRVLDQGTCLEDAPAVARLREAGAVLIGMTTTPELGWKGVTDSDRHGVTRNPWNLKYTPGGSSGGAAAAAALNLGCLHIGTDGGGSIRIPAAFTGIFGIKPSFGRVPAYPASAFGTVAHIGPMTRSVRDASVMLNILSQPDKRDWFSLPEQASISQMDFSNDKPLSGMRIAYSPDLGYMSVAPDVAQAVSEAANVISDLGADVEEISPPFENPQQIFETLWFSAARHKLLSFDENELSNVDVKLSEAIEDASGITLSDYLDATHQRTSLGMSMEKFFGEWDALITPTLPCTAFDAGQETQSGKGRWTDWAGFNFPFNLTQQPSCSVPCGFGANNMPVGLQITSRKYADELVLKIAAAVERAIPPIFPDVVNPTRSKDRTEPQPAI